MEKENKKFSSFPMEKDILGFCLRKGLLIDKETLNLFSGATDVESAKLIIEKIKEQKRLAEDKANSKVFSIDASQKIEIEKQEDNEESFVKAISTYRPAGKKFEVGDFVNYYRSRFAEIRG